MEFQVLDILRADDDSGLVATITHRKNLKTENVEFTFNIGKEFELKFGGETKRTSYIPWRALGSYRSLTDKVENRIRLEQDRLAERRRVAR